MPDVDIQCMSCGNQISVSDVVNVDKLKCRSCGGDFLRTNADAAPAGPSPEEKRKSMMKSLHKEDAKQKLALSKNKSGKEQPEEENASRLAWEKLNNPEGQAEVQRQSQKMYSGLTWKAWLLFIIIGIIAGTLRYSGLIPSSVIQQAAIYEALTVLVLHIFIVLKAFQDSVFQGVLCVLLPPYSIYYLFSASDDFYLRALVGGLLVGLGQDSGILFHEWSMSAVVTVNEWIASGG